MASHRWAWSTRNSRFQRVLESKQNGAKTAINKQKELEKSPPNSLGARCREFESPHSDQKSEITPISWTFMLQFMGVIFMRLTREQKLEMVLKHLNDGVSFTQLAREYQLSTDKVKYFVSLSNAR